MVSDVLRSIDVGVGEPVLILVLMEYGLWPAGRIAANTAASRLNPCSNGIWSLTPDSVWPDSAFWVLILVLMEYGLWQRRIIFIRYSDTVLILVLMEYGLWRPRSCSNSSRKRVLILVLMEYGLWQLAAASREEKEAGLNPCSNGIWSLTDDTASLSLAALKCLNPCSNGIWSLTWLLLLLPQ